MSITRRATDAQQASYREIPDGFFGCYEIGEPKLRKQHGQYGEYWLVDFPLSLTETEKERIKELLGEPEKDQLQSWRPAFGGYSVGYKLGRYKRDGTYEPSELVDFMAAAFGTKNQRDFRKFIESGGGPDDRPEYTEEQSIAAICSWLRWLEGAEIYGTIKHEDGKLGILARFGGPVPIGSLPGQPEPDYQKMMAGKLRAMIAESSGGAGTAPAYDAKGEPVATTAETGDTPDDTGDAYERLFGVEDKAKTA